jgi:hypothetical protein
VDPERADDHVEVRACALRRPDRAVQVEHQRPSRGPAEV